MRGIERWEKRVWEQMGIIRKRKRNREKIERDEDRRGRKGNKSGREMENLIKKEREIDKWEGRV